MIGERKWKRMAKKRNSECWYSQVCNMDNPCNNCLRFTEMKYLMDNSGLPKRKQQPIQLDGSRDPKAFQLLAEIKNDILKATIVN